MILYIDGKSLNLVTQQFFNMRTLLTVLSLIISTSVFVGCQNKNTYTSKPEWQQLLNEKDLDDWIPKIRKHEVGVNYQNTLYVKDGKMINNNDCAQYIV